MQLAYSNNPTIQVEKSLMLSPFHFSQSVCFHSVTPPPHPSIHHYMNLKLVKTSTEVVFPPNSHKSIEIQPIYSSIQLLVS